MRRILIPAFCLLVSVAVSCTDRSQEQQALEVSASGDTVRIPQTSTLFPKISTSVLSLTPYARTISATGVVQAIPANYAEVSTPFPGRVIRSLVSIGQKVQAGTPLFEISSSGGGEVVKNYLQSKIYAYNRGETPLLEVLNAQRTFNEVSVSYAQCLHDCLSALVELERSAGIWDITL